MSNTQGAAAIRGRKRPSDGANDEERYKCKRFRLTKRTFVEERHGESKVYNAVIYGGDTQAGLQGEATQPIIGSESKASDLTKRMSALEIRELKASKRIARAAKGPGARTYLLCNGVREQSKSLSADRVLPKPVQAVVEARQIRGPLLANNESSQSDIPVKTKSTRKAFITPTSPQSLLDLPNVDPLKTEISSAQQEALVQLHVRPFFAPYVGGYCTNTGARKHSWFKGMSPFACYTLGDVMAFSACTGVTKELFLESVLIAHCDEPSKSQEDDEEAVHIHSHDAPRLQIPGTAPRAAFSVFQQLPTWTHDGLSPPTDLPQTNLLLPDVVTESSAVARAEDPVFPSSSRCQDSDHISQEEASAQPSFLSNSSRGDESLTSIHPQSQLDTMSPHPNDPFRVGLSGLALRLPMRLRSFFPTLPNNSYSDNTGKSFAGDQELDDDTQEEVKDGPAMQTEVQSKTKKKKKRQKKKKLKDASICPESRMVYDPDAQQLHGDDSEQDALRESPDMAKVKDVASKEMKLGTSDQHLRLHNEEKIDASETDNTISGNEDNDEVPADMDTGRAHTEHKQTRRKHRAGRKRASSKLKAQGESVDSRLDIYDAIEMTGAPQTLEQLEMLAQKLAQGIDARSIENLPRCDNLLYGFDLAEMLDEYGVPVQSSDQVLRHQDALLSLLNFKSALHAPSSDAYEDHLAQASSSAIQTYNNPLRPEQNGQPFGEGLSFSTSTSRPVDAEDPHIQFSQLLKDRQQPALLPNKSRTASVKLLTPVQIENRIRKLEERNERQSQRIKFLEQGGSLTRLLAPDKAFKEENAQLRKRIRELEIENKWLCGMHNEDTVHESKVVVKH